MSNGMYCSASQKIDSANSDSVITGSVIFLTITALPESEAQTSFALNDLLCSKTRRIASATAPASMMAPSTIESGGTGSLPNAATRNPFPDGFSSTAFTALDPMSSPTTALVLRNILWSSASVFCPAVRCTALHRHPETEVRRPGRAKVQTATAVPSASRLIRQISRAISGVTDEAAVHVRTPGHKTVSDSHFCRARCACSASNTLVIGIFWGGD